MKQINALTSAITNSLFIAIVIIVLTTMLFSCSKADALVDQPAVESGVVLNIDGKEYQYKGVQVSTAVVEPSWHNMLCTQNNNNTGSFGFRVGGLYSDSLYILGNKDVVLTFKAGSVTYSNTTGLSAFHITGKTGNRITGYFDVPITNNTTGAAMRATGTFNNILFNR
jgi:hypothetical protein